MTLRRFLAAVAARSLLVTIAPPLAYQVPRAHAVVRSFRATAQRANSCFSHQVVLPGRTEA